MKIRDLLLSFLLLAAAAPAWAGFEFLDRHEKPFPWTPEPSSVAALKLPPARTDLSPFYKDFAADGEVSIYIGYGVEASFPGRNDSLNEMLWSLASYYGLPLDNWRYNGQSIRFRDRRTNLSYRIVIGDERNAFIAAWEKYEVVLYHGHSRYGRGPAFRSYTNYFRIGERFKTIEVEANNPYFVSEPLQNTELFPPKKVWYGSVQYDYQYRGQRSSSSYLPPDAFTKVIPGLDADLKTTKLKPGRQLFYFYSCSNRDYWEKTLRAVMPDPSQKFIFGTDENGWGGTKPDAMMIISVVRGLADSDSIIANLNATGDCASCFTAY